MISVQHLTKRIGSSMVLDDITLQMLPGKVTGLVGPNGSGKTMLMRVLVGLVKPSSGKVTINGVDAWAHAGVGSAGDVPAPTIGLLLEGPAFLGGYTGLQNLEFLASIRGCIGTDEVREAIREMGLDPDDKRKYRKYSLGMKQRLGIAGAVMEKPDILVLDEPTNALDVSGVQLVLDQIEKARGRGAVVVLASHDDEVMRGVADEVWHLAEGHIDGHEVLRESDEPTVSLRGDYDGR